MVLQRRRVDFSRNPLFFVSCSLPFLKLRILPDTELTEEQDAI